jgi:hypothetical protein
MATKIKKRKTAKKLAKGKKVEEVKPLTTGSGAGAGKVTFNPW